MGDNIGLVERCGMKTKVAGVVECVGRIHATHRIVGIFVQRMARILDEIA
jgi:hypothetical protein